MSELYALDGIRRVFGEREVLNIPNLTLQRGVIYGLLGPNGAGKTTLMRLLSFMDTPTDGTIRFMGREVRPDQAGRYRARVVWVPQSPVMFTGTLLYNVEYPMRLKGVGGKERRERAMALLETVDLARLAKSPAHRLSGGEAQRGSIARALAAGAEVILFDEPTASVDFRSRGEIIRLIRELNERRGLSVIVTTHDAALAAALCRERIVLFDGRIVPRLPLYSGEEGEDAAPLQAHEPAPWPARLERGGRALRLPGPLLSGPPSLQGRQARLEALAANEGGILLRLRPEASAGTDEERLPALSAFLTHPDDLREAGTLTLGVALSLLEEE